MTMTYLGPMTKPFWIKMREEYAISIGIVARIQHRYIEQKKRNHRITFMLSGLIFVENSSSVRAFFFIYLSI